MITGTAAFAGLVPALLCRPVLHGRQNIKNGAEEIGLTAYGCLIRLEMPYILLIVYGGKL